MSVDILTRCHQDGLIDPRELADLFDLSLSGAYRYFEATELSYSRLRRLFRAHPKVALLQRFLDDLLATRSMVAVEVADAGELDANGDGRLDAEDALTGALDLSIKSATAAARIHASAEDRIISAAELGTINELLGQVIAEAARARQIVNVLAERHASRRQARPLPREAVRR